MDAGSLCSVQRAENSVAKIQKVAEKFENLWKDCVAFFANVSEGRFLAKHLELHSLKKLEIFIISQFQ